MKPTAYFWKDGEVVEFFQLSYMENVREAGLENLFCLDVLEKNPPQRYGYFHPTKCWIPVPLEEFPKEFLTTLMLLGIPI
jgi:hypothetical protein